MGQVAIHLFTSLNKALQKFAIFVQGYKVFRVLKVFDGAEYFYNQLKQSHHYFFCPPQALSFSITKSKGEQNI